MKRNRILIYILFFVILIIGLLLLLKAKMILHPPTITDKSALSLKRIQVNDSLYVCDNSWLHISESGLRELYIAGSPFELGVKNGILTRELVVRQEYEFINFIKGLIPSNATLNYLKYFIAWFNKDLDEYIPIELQKEVYGISEFASKDFEYIAPNYHRILNYHAAHDIGHTIQNMNLVACTAFSVNNDRTSDSSLLIGRNFDFSAGDAFAKEKIVAFCAPDSGNNFMYVTWGGMIGVLSGMNDQGLTVTLNSAKSGIPVSAKTPVSFVSRMILQYASNIDQAFAIAKSYDTFVSESFFIASAEDNSTAIIEKTIEKTILFKSDKSSLILTNHFQSAALKNTDLNKESIEEGSSAYRFKRVEELLKLNNNIDYSTVAEILRNKQGLANKEIGMGNEKAINQLLCHHSVIFNPKKKIVWVSEYPYQLGRYIAYNLDSIFSDDFDILSKREIYDSTLIIPEDDFIRSTEYMNFKEYKERTNYLKLIISGKIDEQVSEAYVKTYLQFNENFYYPYFVIAEYYRFNNDFVNAKKNYNYSLTKEFPRKVDRQQVENALAKININ